MHEERAVHQLLLSARTWQDPLDLGFRSSYATVLRDGCVQAGIAALRH